MARTQWDQSIGAALLAVSDLLETLSPAQWESPSLCEGWRVKDAAGHLVVRVGSSRAELLRLAARTWWEDKRLGPMAVLDTMSRNAATAEYGDLVARLRQVATQRAVGDGPTGLGELVECVVHGFDLANPLGAALPFPPEVTYAVARSSTLLPFGRATRLLRERTLVASDAHWQLGNGPVIEGTAEAIVLYLYGRKQLAGTERVSRAGRAPAPHRRASAQPAV